MGKYKFTKVGGRQYRSWKLWNVGDTMIARYIKPYEDQYNNTNHEVEILETSFQNTDDDIEEGKIFGVNYCGSIDFKLGDCVKGDVIQLEYQGTGVVEKGPMKGKDFHMVEVGVDDSNREAVVPEDNSEPEEHDL